MTVVHTLDLREADVSTIFKKTLDTIAAQLAADLYAVLFGKETKRKTGRNYQADRSGGQNFINRRIHSGLSPPVCQ